MDPNLALTIAGSLFAGGVAWGFARADVAKLREDNTHMRTEIERIRLRQEQTESLHAKQVEQLNRSISDLGNRLTAIETTLNLMREDLKRT